MSSLPLRTNGNAAAAVCQGNPVHHVARRQVNEVHRDNPKLVLLRQAIDESGIKHAAIAAALQVKPNYLSMLLSGEKTWNIKHQDALPDEVERIYSRMYAETFADQIVAQLPVDEADAARSLVRGVFGLLTRLPQRAARMAKCDLPDTAR